MGVNAAVCRHLPWRLQDLASMQQIQGGHATALLQGEGMGIYNNLLIWRPALRSWGDSTVKLCYCAVHGPNGGGGGGGGCNYATNDLVKKAKVSIAYNVRNISSCTIPITLTYLSKLMTVQRAVLRWTCSIWTIRSFVCWSRVFKAVSRTFGIFVLMYLRMNPFQISISSLAVYMRIPGETAGDINLKILGTSDDLQDLAMEFWEVSCQLYHMTFRGVELDVPPVSHVESLVGSF